MRYFTVLYAISSFFLVATLLPEKAFAMRQVIEHLPIQLAQSREASSKSQAAEIAKSQYGGKVLSVSELIKNGRKVYRVKLLLQPSGRVKIVTISGS